jgi:hypothetical protein
MDAKLNSMTQKKVFQCFKPFWPRLAYEFVKSPDMTPKKFSQNIFSMGINLMLISNPLKKYQESLHKEN